MSLCDTVSFLKLSSVLDEINSSKKDQKFKLLKNFIQHFQSQASKNGKPFCEELSFYPILRLLLPKDDRKRGPYGIKEYTLAKLYVRILCLNRGTKDYNMLTQYKSPKSSSGTQSGGDFSEVAYAVLKTRCGKGGELSVTAVNRHLDNIAVKHTNHDPRGVETELQLMLTKMSALEQKWLIRVLLKDLHVGLGGSNILDCFHQDASDLYDVCHNLQKVCTVLNNPNARLHEIEVVLYEPFRPMLSKRLDIQAIEKDLRTRDFYYVEPKHDGERFQLHMSDGKFKYFSRNGHEYTRTYGEDNSSGILTPHIIPQLSSSVQSCILDGEMMCWNKKYGTYTPKGANIDVKKLRMGMTHQACYCVFDILLYNGTVLSNKPLSERLDILQDVFTSREGFIVHTPRAKVHSKSQVLPALNKAIDDREEGIVVKEPDALYKPHSRKDGWYKIKPEYTDGAMVELDMLIIGGYYGKGSQRGIVSQFLLGLLDTGYHEESEGRTEGPTYISAGKVGIGLSMEELVDLSQKMSPHWNRTRVGQLPGGIVWTREKPDLWVAPEHSYILQIKATEVARSDAFKVQYYPRFPRITAVRYDKSPRDCLTTTEFHRIRSQGAGKLCYQSIGVGSRLTQSSRSPRKRKEMSLGSEYTCNVQESLTLVSHIFKHRTLCVLTGGDVQRKNDLETKIVQNGGKVVQNSGSTTWAIVTSDPSNIRVKHALAARTHSIVRAEWVDTCVGRGVLLAWTPGDVLCVVGDDEVEMNNKFDQYGDSYTSPVSLEHLPALLSRMDEKPIPLLTPPEIGDLERDLYSGSTTCESIFRGSVAYFATPSRLARVRFRFYGGIVSEKLSGRVTTVVLGEGEEVERLRRQVERLRREGEDSGGVGADLKGDSSDLEGVTTNLNCVSTHLKSVSAGPKGGQSRDDVSTDILESETREENERDVESSIRERGRVSRSVRSEKDGEISQRSDVDNRYAALMDLMDSDSRETRTDIQGSNRSERDRDSLNERKRKLSEPEIDVQSCSRSERDVLKESVDSRYAMLTDLMDSGSRWTKREQSFSRNEEERSRNIMDAIFTQMIEGESKQIKGGVHRSERERETSMNELEVQRSRERHPDIKDAIFTKMIEGESKKTKTENDGDSISERGMRGCRSEKDRQSTNRTERDGDSCRNIMDAIFTQMIEGENREPREQDSKSERDMQSRSRSEKDRESTNRSEKDRERTHRSERDVRNESRSEREGDNSSKIERECDNIRKNEKKGETHTREIEIGDNDTREIKRGDNDTREIKRDKKEVCFVNESWIEKCIRSGSLLPPLSNLSL